MTVNLVGLFQSLRMTLCLCPLCGTLSRLSDLNLKYKGKVPRTWLDKHESKLKRLEDKEQLFEEMKKQLLNDARERGRRKALKSVCKCLDSDIARFNYDPYDIKALFHPVDFVVFNGLNQEKLKDVAFLSKKTSSSILNKTRRSLELAIDKEQYDWRLAKVSINGTIELE